MSKVIMYHYIRKFDKDFYDFNFLHFKDFKKQIDYFYKCGGLVKISDNLDQIYKKKKFILTFDDGLKEHLKIAKYLKKKNILGLFFIPGRQLINSDFLAIHKLHLVFGKFSASKITQFCIKNKIQINFGDKVFKTFKLQKNYINKEKPYSEKNFKIYLKTTLNNLRGSKRKLIHKLFDHFVNKKEQKKIFKNFYLNKKDIKYIDKIGMKIGSHGFDHNVLSKKKYVDQNKDITRSIKVLSGILNKEIKLFCYPYGGFNVFNNNTIKILKKEKITHSFSVQPKDWNIKSNSFYIPRYDCNLFKHGKIYQKK